MSDSLVKRDFTLLRQNRQIHEILGTVLKYQPYRCSSLVAKL